VATRSTRAWRTADRAGVRPAARRLLRAPVQPPASDHVAGVQADRCRPELLEVDRTANRLRRAAEREHAVPEPRAAMAGHEVRRRRPVTVRQDRVGTVRELHRRDAEPIRAVP
jgi:hypothetical protein